MEQSWFEMHDIRRRQFNTASWVPLTASVSQKNELPYAYSGHHEEYFGVHTLAVPAENRAEAEKLDWQNYGLSDDGPVFEEGIYIPADIYTGNDSKMLGVKLVLKQRLSGDDNNVYHLHQDLIMALGLKREGDLWVRPSEGYETVARLSRNKNGEPTKLEIRAIHLKDYLCARGMSLFLLSYRSRFEIADSADYVSWSNTAKNEADGFSRWQGRAWAIHEGRWGMPYGEKVAVFHAARTDVDPTEDVPIVVGPPTNDNTTSTSWEKSASGRKVFRIQGELWRAEWVEPMPSSPLVRGDEVPSTVEFITDNDGTREKSITLVEGSRWLWFRPDVVMALVGRRGGSLEWYTKDTGGVGCSPDYSVHFGINPLGLVNAYAKDIGLLPEWQQKIWAAHNVAPEGGVSDELLASQMKAEPAETLAPEAFLQKGLERVNKLSEEKFGITIFRPHERLSEIITNTHRFRATTPDGLYSLAKDLARLTADSIDAVAIQKIVAPPKGTRWGSLKSLENLLAQHIAPPQAHVLLSPLFGIYELRLADAHLPAGDLATAFESANVNTKSPYVAQGFQLLDACVGVLFMISEVMEKAKGSQLPAITNPA